MTDATDDAEFVQQWIACEIEQHGQWIHDDRTSRAARVNSEINRMIQRYYLWLVESGTVATRTDTHHWPPSVLPRWTGDAPFIDDRPDVVYFTVGIPRIAYTECEDLPWSSWLEARETGGVDPLIHPRFGMYQSEDIVKSGTFAIPRHLTSPDDDVRVTSKVPRAFLEVTRTFPELEAIRLPKLRNPKDCESPRVFISGGSLGYTAFPCQTGGCPTCRTRYHDDVARWFIDRLPEHTYGLVVSTQKWSALSRMMSRKGGLIRGYPS